MNFTLGNKIVISVGGSLMFPGAEPDALFLKSFREIILQQVFQTDREFFIVTGGGQLCRVLNRVIESVRDVSELDKHILGTRTTQLNGYLMHAIFSDIADPYMVCDYDEYARLRDQNTKTYRVTVGAGWKFGHSTDVDAMCFARVVGAREVINLSKPTHVFDKDPVKFPGAKSFSKLTWSEYLGLVPKEFTPGAHVPFDQIASREAQERGVAVIIMNPGNDLMNFDSLLQGKEFEGTVISS